MRDYMERVGDRERLSGRWAENVVKNDQKQIIFTLQFWSF